MTQKGDISPLRTVPAVEIPVKNKMSADVSKALLLHEVGQQRVSIGHEIFLPGSGRFTGGSGVEVQTRFPAIRLSNCRIHRCSPAFGNVKKEDSLIYTA